MAYDRKKIFEQAKEVIVKNKLFFVDDIVPILPFSKIDEMGAGMYKGEKITLAERQKQAAEA